ncbi:hypothetical protein XcuCFBP2542_07435 [Xanthomonas cucurbitae]|uniref:Uncharacterized protein n=1 Tax=Xanthomonas cucurbitae TaxID=56453 RepID=A0A2S7DTN2_9XANT|nr:hypothetical protein XcuCFBP2542_07435 [Xanthomonas cucurbitae]QHG88945.1 hypothetical protein EBN15_01665 [Xanthomonas cucurbitae]
MSALLLAGAPAVSHWMQSAPGHAAAQAMCRGGHLVAGLPLDWAYGPPRQPSGAADHALPHEAACEHCVLAALLLTPHDWTLHGAAPACPDSCSEAFALCAPRFAHSAAHRPRGPPVMA